MDNPYAYMIYIEDSIMWHMHFDGYFNYHGLGAGVVLITPIGDFIPHDFRLSFLCTNNIIEYEALIASLKIIIRWNI